jgi:hypothetical protein
MTNKKVYDYKECEEGQILVQGKYLGPTENTMFGGNNYNYAPLDDSKTVMLWGAGHLAFQMDAIEVGTTVQVTYMGVETLEKGQFKGKPSHQFDVAVAEAEELEAPAPKETTENAKGVDVEGLD